MIYMVQSTQTMIREISVKYQIGDFSKISRLSIKTLRYYHECGLLEPTEIDQDSGYRYYDENCLEKVKMIHELKELGFPLKEIKQILATCREDADLLTHMMEKYNEINRKIADFHAMKKKLEVFIHQTETTEGIQVQSPTHEITIKEIPDILMASIRFKGRYQEVGNYFKKLFRRCARYVNGTPFALYYDNEYKEEDADIEACVPVKVAIYAEEIGSRVLKGGKVISLIHKGPYETFGESYKKLIDYKNENNIKTGSPSREIYIKGPGLIIPRSPKKFITEIQVPVED